MICGYCGVGTTEADSYASQDGRYRICIRADECLQREPPVICNLCRRDIPIIDRYTTGDNRVICIDAGPCLQRSLDTIRQEPVQVVKVLSQEDIMKGWAMNV